MTMAAGSIGTAVEPIVRVDRMLNVTFVRTDVAAMHRYLLDFGFVLAASDGQTTYYRGYGQDSWIVAVTSGDQDAFAGFSMAVNSRPDLERLAAETGAAIEDDPRPGGGSRIRLNDPNGTAVDIIYGAATVDPLPTRVQEMQFNTPFEKRRVNETVRTPPLPSPIFKLGHVVFQCGDFDMVAAWYARHFGFLASDLLTLADGSAALGFFRLNRGKQPADHHSLALLDGPGFKLLHVSFETFDLESIGQGAQVLMAGGHKHHWGPGRHVLGSQIFDYWKDPAGDEWEHYVDGDVMTEEYPTGYHPLDREGLWSWGHDLPPDLRPDITPQQVAELHAQGVFGNKDIDRMVGLVQAMLAKPRPWLS